MFTIFLPNVSDAEASWVNQLLASTKKIFRWKVILIMNFWFERLSESALLLFAIEKMSYLNLISILNMFN